jgi:hypothetical protein
VQLSALITASSLGTFFRGAFLPSFFAIDTGSYFASVIIGRTRRSPIFHLKPRDKQEVYDAE